MLSFLSTHDNCIKVTEELLSILKVRVTNTTLKNELYNHPDYPSLLAISDILTGYGIENISTQITIDKLVELPVPFIVPLKNTANAEGQFTVIESIQGDTIKYYRSEKYRWENISKEDFEKKWLSGIVLLVDAENAIDEKEYVAKRREEKRVNMAKAFTWLALPVLTMLACALMFAKYGLTVVFPIVFTLLTLMGCIISTLLLWYELDEYNPVLKQICGSGKKVDCGAVLNTKASKIAGISWSVIGFTYFTAELLALLFGGIANVRVLFILTGFNVLAIPYVFFSVYYQWRIAKQWCVLCLCVQSVLVLQLITVLIAKWYKIATVDTVFSGDVIIPILFAIAIPFIIVNLLLPAYRSAKGGRQNKAELQRLKHNPQIFEALLTKQKAIAESTEGLGIILGNPDASYKIIKVCNPYCGPCAKAHAPLEELLHNNPDIQIQILFTATTNADDIKAPPVKHLLAIAEGGEAIVRQALDDWYLADQKDYEAFAVKYPVSNKLEQQDDKVNNMKEWCNKTGISFTPTIFVNGYQLPEIYDISDLKYFLSV